MRPKNKESTKETFTTLDARAVIFATPDEQAVLIAMQTLHWWRGKEAKGLELIKAVLIDPDRKKLKSDDPAYQTQITERGIKRALASLRKRGWVITERKTAYNGFREAMGFTMTVPAISWDEVYAIILSRLPQGLRDRLKPFNKKEAAAGQPGLFDPPAEDKQAFTYLPFWAEELNAPYRKKYGRNLSDTKANGNLMMQARTIYGVDMGPSWQHYLAATGYKGCLTEACHPLKWYISTPDTWKTIVDNQATRSAAAVKKQEAEAKELYTKMNQDNAKDEKMLAKYLALPITLRQLLLDRASAISRFAHDWILKHKYELRGISDTRFTMIKEAWLEYPDPPVKVT